MEVPAARRCLPKNVLLGLLPAAFEPWGSSARYPSRAPSAASVRRIQTELRIPLPALFVEVAAACPAYGGWFGSIGDDFDSHNHILSINRAFREEGLSPQYVMFNHGHDGDCDAWDLEAAPAAGELPIVHFNYDRDRRVLTSLRSVATCFADYIDAFVRATAPRCPEKELCRRAKRALAPYVG